MTVTAVQIARLRRMIAEPTDDTYTDGDLTTTLELHPLPDAVTDELTSVDENAAAADIWEEKAALFAADFDFAADGGDYKRSQAYLQMLAMAKRYRAKRSSSSVILQAYPKPLGAVRLESWVGNLSELATENDYE